MVSFSYLMPSTVKLVNLLTVMANKPENHDSEGNFFVFWPVLAVFYDVNFIYSIPVLCLY